MYFIGHSLKLVVFFANTLFVANTFADVRFCYKGLQTVHSNQAVNNSSGYCPYGLLFKEPVVIGAVQPAKDPLEHELQFCFNKNICVRDDWHCSNRLQYTEAQLIIPGKIIDDKTTLVESDEIINPDVPICEPFPIITDVIVDELQDDNYLTSIGMKQRKKRQVRPNPTIKDKLKNSDTEIQAVIDEQTKRMFYFITGVNVEDVSSHLRVTKLFHNSVRLVHMICDPLFLKQEFLDNVEQGFLYLLKQQGLERLSDVDVDDFVMLSRALDYCMGDPDASVFIEGNHCPANFFVESVRRKDVQIPFDREDEANFVWGKHDVVVDAAWHIIDIVMGICFATFKENLNLHHKFQVVMEQMFRDSVHLRWSSVSEFQREDRVDNVFTIPVNMSMEVLDACSQGAYIGSPFLHRLQRPEVNSGSRKRRSLEQIPQNSLKDVAYCLQSQEELEDRMRKIQEKQCAK